MQGVTKINAIPCFTSREEGCGITRLLALSLEIILLRKISISEE